MKNFKTRIGGALLTLSILFGVGVATSATTQAQWNRNTQWQRQRDYERQQRQRQREYEREQRRRAREQSRNSGYYGNDPYNRNNGGYYGNNGYGFDNARQTALNAGYNNGIEEGRKDRQRNERFEYRDEGDFQSASEDYSSRLGIDREQYRAYFRQGFANGYRAGYNGY